jgi:hypothetical protein
MELRWNNGDCAFDPAALARQLFTIRSSPSAGTIRSGLAELRLCRRGLPILIWINLNIVAATHARLEIRPLSFHHQVVTQID